MWDQVDRRFFAPISAAWLAVLRIGFGAIMFYEAIWFLGIASSSPDHNQIEALFTGKSVQWTFSYPGFAWIKPLPEPWTTALFVIMAIGSGLMVLGVCYRVASASVFVTFAYINLMDASIYLNHFYLMCVVAFLMTLVPADRRFAIRHVARSVSDGLIPQWTILLFRFQVFVVYFFAGLAKINRDWLVGEPLRRWLPHTASAKTLEPLLGVTGTEFVRAVLSADVTVMALSYGGLVFDLLIGFLLLWARTRTAALILVVLFHVMNFIVFDIGAFPVMAVLLTTVFFAPDWPERLARQVCSASPTRSVSRPPRLRRNVVVCGVFLWVGLQCVLPLRHYLIPGNVSWTEEGHRFSWRMKLRDKVPGPFLVEVVPVVAEDVGEAAALAGTHVTYQDVNACEIPWSELPPLVVTYEPLLGERLIFNPLADATWTDSLRRARLAWRAATGRELKLQRCVSFERAIAATRQQIKAMSPNWGGDFVGVDRAYQGLRLAKGANQQHLQLVLQERLYDVVRRSELRKPFLKQLWQTAPFACQGAHTETTAPFMVAFDTEIVRSAEFACTELNRARTPEMGPTLIDLRGLAPASWRALPEVIHCESERDGVTAVWNYRRDLHSGQLKALRSSPLLQHEYANYVADRWEDRHGVRPAVHVTSFVKLNQHASQRIVDQQVDLASEVRHIWWRNSWILPLRRSTSGFGLTSLRVSEVTE